MSTRPAGAAGTGIAWSAARIAQVTEQPPPTPEQVAVIQAPLQPMLVVAGAGSGKTATMAARVVYLLANALVEPEEVLGLTFTRKAAAELADRMRRRLAQVRAAGAPIDPDSRPRVATYNSYAGALVREHALRVGMPPDAVHVGDAGRFQIAERIVLTWAGDLRTSYRPSTLVDGVTALDGELNEHGVDPRDAARRYAELAAELLTLNPAKSHDATSAAAALTSRAQLMDLVVAFREHKREHGQVDFGEEVRLAARIAQAAPDVGEGERTRYRAVLLDEYQDTSIAQVALLSRLFGGGHPVTAVGDPNQAIYGWRGAAAGTLHDFPTTFARADGDPAATATLATAWRNDVAILRAANAVATPLREQAAGAVPVLVERPAAGPGVVRVRFAETVLDEAATIAEHLANRPADAGGAPASAAVLCRKRSQFEPIALALRERGVPVQVVGLAGLLTTPEVADIWVALQCVHDPGRGDALMRLLTGPAVNLGAHDLLALGGWAAAQARRRDRPEHIVPEEAEVASLVEAIDAPPPPGWRDPAGRELSDVARRRLRTLSGGLAQLRALGYLSLPELVATTEQVLGLDIEVAAQRPGPVGQARRNLDELAAVAARFSADATDPSLGAFLAWLDAALEEERGLDTTEAEPDPAAVQVLTVHAAKGLEWDVVVVPGMVEGTFPTTAPVASGARRGSGWLTGASTLPYELRGDADHLPELDISGATTTGELKAAIEDFKIREGARELAEERRLAYVALTRARHELLLTGAFWRDAKKPAVPSLFLIELGAVAGLVEGGWPEASAHRENPMLALAHTASWPRQPTAPAPVPLPGVAPADDAVVRQWWADAELLLAERDEVRQGGEVAPPTHLSASQVVALGEDAARFYRDRRRPVPRRPSVQARRGTRFHAWVERHFGAQALLDTDELPGVDDPSIAGEAELDDLIEAFMASPWANRTPVRVEADVDTPVGDTTIRCRIDAVFSDGPDRYHVVDWKTGPPPTDPEERRARGIQLALYRLAWSRYAQVPLDSVRASFHHVAQNVTIPAPDGEGDADDLERSLAALLRG